MRAEELRHQITLQARTVTRSASGAEVIAWTDLATVWVSINPIAGKEYFASKQVNAEVTHRINMRYRSGVRPSMRLKHGARVFSILSAINVGEKNIELELMCKEVV